MLPFDGKSSGFSEMLQHYIASLVTTVIPPLLAICGSSCEPLLLIYFYCVPNRPVATRQPFYNCSLCSPTIDRASWLPSAWATRAPPRGRTYISPKGEHQSAGSTLDIWGCFAPVPDSDTIGGTTGDLDSSPQPSRLLCR